MTATLPRPVLEATATAPAAAAIERTTAIRHGLTDDQLDAFGAELDAIRDRIIADRGQADVDYMRRIIKIQRGLAVSGRASLFLGFLPPFWVYGAGALGIAKILDNMEIGHNVMHGQYDWTQDPALSSSEFDWDTVCPGDQWKHSHNYLHHTFTNVVGLDRDIGYGILRMSEGKPWRWYDVFNPVKATALMLAFDHGVMLHDVETENILSGKKSFAQQWPILRDGLKKSAKLDGKDYVLWPLLTGPLFLSTLAANATANLMRNLWSFSIIFCGHFPEGTHEFSMEECADESKGHWYFRQLLGSANIRGNKLFHVLSGNLSHQIEHHLFPDLPANRYQEIAPEVEEICNRYGLPYNARRFTAQLGSTWKKIWKLALPGS
ncbi:fatty acid desaturase family protein [Actinospongicola halichondriae]|uniref:fatty acid desaturase family protein n=1 Tax=Actinospongicola halichondriae TaxID=3236844 RepID=UPI003D3F3F20